jgi:uncharacterized membrane protein (DUF485 family)
MNKKTFFFILLGALLLPVSAFAQVTIQGMVNAAVQTTLYIASGVVVILWVVTGLIFLSASGDPTKVTQGRKALLASVIGTLLIIVASSAVYLVGQAFGL